MTGTAVKICGVTSVAEAELCVEEGADAIGLNFYPRSSRYIDAGTARKIVEAVGGAALTVGVFVDAGLDAIRQLQASTGVRCVQLHGDESPELLASLLPHAYKAVRVKDEGSVADARRYGGEHILLDAYVPGEQGGTGHTFRWELAVPLARERRVTLAGGLRPENVAAAIHAVRPFCVDVASGVESRPGVKDHAAVRAFIIAAKSA
jgi:phosphoribosylanthranilate isomerase